MKPKLFVTIKGENNMLELSVEGLQLPEEGLEVVLVSNLDMKTVQHLQNYDTVEVYIRPPVP
jgi:hypothetical protein